MLLTDEERQTLAEANVALYRAQLRTLDDEQVQAFDWGLVCDAHAKVAAVLARDSVLRRRDVAA